MSYTGEYTLNEIILDGDTWSVDGEFVYDGQTFDRLQYRSIPAMYIKALSLFNGEEEYIIYYNGSWLGTGNRDLTIVSVVGDEAFGEWLSANAFRFDMVDIIGRPLDEMAKQLNVASAVDVAGLAVSAAVVLAFMWWGVRKLKKAIMAAWKKGRVSL